VANVAVGPRPVVDLAHLNPRTASDVIAWFESDESRSDDMILVYSHGALHHEGFPVARALTLESAARLRALGGFIGLCVAPPFYDHPAALRAGIEAAAALLFRGNPGYEGIAIGTDFMGVDETAAGLRNVPEVLAWISAAFAPDAAAALTCGNASALFARMTGAVERSGPR
jgi:membrane dipeptidase